MRQVDGFRPATAREDAVGKEIVDAAYTVHTTLGPGLLEKVYEIGFCHELQKRGLKLERQVEAPVTYDGVIIDGGFRIDVLVEDLVVCELKAAERPAPSWEAQLLTYLKLTGKRLGYLINFGAPRIKDGLMRRVV